MRAPDSCFRLLARAGCLAILGGCAAAVPEDALPRLDEPASPRQLVSLRAGTIVWEVRPDTLAVRARVEGDLIPVSEPQEPREFTHLEVDDAVARWRTFDGIAVECTADERGLEVTFSCRKRMAVEWPVVTARGGHGFVLPRFEAQK